MLHKITHIASISRFKNFSSNDDELSFSQSNLIFAPNGRGKSTLSDIFQSFLKNKPDILSKRKSRVYPGSAEITLTHSEPQVAARFSEGSWKNILPDVSCVVFDKDFIQQNIHTITVEHDHKKKLHGLIVGESAIEARKIVKEKRDALIDAQKSQRGIAEGFHKLGVKNITLDSFLKLNVGDAETLNTERTLLEKQLEALGNPEIVKAKPEMLSINTIDFDLDGLLAACKTTVDGGSKEAIELIKSHTTTHIHGSQDDKKAFLAAGVKALGSKATATCSLCGQTLGMDAKKIIDALFTIFSSQYLSLSRQIKLCIGNLKTLDVDIYFQQLERSMEVNQTRREDWSKFVEKLPELYTLKNPKSMQEKVNAAKSSLIDALSLKADEFSKIISSELNDFQVICQELNKEITVYIKCIEEINSAIQNYKKTLNTTKKQSILSRIDEIKNITIRSSEPGKAFCSSYVVVSTKVSKLDSEYKKALADFSVAQKSVIEEHSKLINEILQYCGANFRLDGMVQGTRSGSTDPYIEYGIKLKGGTTEAQTTASEAVGEILSEGEKNLLAFAFFWSLIQHTELKKTIAIFDDPLSSMDHAWRLQLIDKLKELCDTGLLQLFVLTHYEDFGTVVALRMTGIKQITIEAGGSEQGNKLVPYDIASAIKDHYFVGLDKLHTYIGNPTIADPKDIQSEIRRVLETALKHKYYIKLIPLLDGKKWLRDFIEEPSVKPLLVANKSYSTLDTLCVNGGWANHSNPPSLIFNQEQAASYAAVTLDIIEKI